jgi:hypothetical protein
MNVRGLFPSLGAGGSLIAAALCAVALVGGGLAFRGEGPGAAEANAGDIVVPGRTVRAQTTSPTALSTVLALAAAGREAAAEPRAATRPRRVRTRVRAAPPTQRTSPPRVTAPSSPGATAPAAPGTRPSVSSPIPAPTPVPAPTPTVPSGTVETVVEQTRAAAKPVVDAVPAPAQQPVQEVVDTVESVAGTVDQTVDGVTGLLKS